MFKETFTVLAIVAGIAATGAQARDGGPQMQERFGQMDLNSDGQVTVEELQTQAAARFAAADTDGNGALSKEELAASMQERHKERLLKRFDANGDGALSGEELSKLESGKMGKRGAKRFERMDADNSGDISLAELQGRRDPAKMVSKLDTDKSGGLSLEEFSKARGHGKEGGGHKMKRDAD